MRYANEKIVEKLKKRYPDDAGSIMVSWDSGSHLSIIYGEDLCRKINE